MARPDPPWLEWLKSKPGQLTILACLGALLIVLGLIFGPSREESARRREQREFERRQREDEADRRYNERLRRRMGEAP